MFEKIKNIFRRIFLKQKLLQENKTIESELFKTEIKTSNFREELSKNSEIYNIQKMYDEGKITEDELTISQIKKLISLYKEQINY